ncbi:acyl-CoA N-acyltransferase [Cadophora sp. MPI-SDFR-AT-0126]|nr:acyl-CoA N-acyltransferase [Leotiomycetes sp. MPI-SDFR-AT-0126]
MRKTIAISLHPPTSADLPSLARLDIAANSAHPLIALSFPYPFQASKLFLEHLRFCFERKVEYGILVARLRCGVASEPEGSDADSGVDVSSSTVGEGDGERGEIVGFAMWRDRGFARERSEGGAEKGEEEGEWDWLSHLPKGTDTSIWKSYTEVMSSASEVIEGSVEILKLAVSPQHQRRGIGTKLLKACLDEVGGREVHVRASKDAKALYERFGWRCVRVFKLDLREWGRGRTYVNYEMVRDALV